MSWFREFFTLAGMLFYKTTIRTPRVIVMKHFPFKGYSAMMWCGCIITRDEHSGLSEVTLRHECLHQRQAYYYNRYYRWYLRYVWEWLKGNPLRNPGSSAYYTNPFEMEAYGNEMQAEYYPRKGSWKHYAVKNRKSTYRRHSHAWRAYCRMLAKEVEL